MSAIAYKADFIVWSLVSIGWFIFNIVFYNLLYTNVNDINGWTKPDMFLFQGFYFIIDFFIWGVLWQNMKALPMKVNSGSLDMDLIKPVNKRFLLSFRIFRWNNFNSFLLGIAIIIYAIITGGMKITVMGVILSIFSLIFSFILIYTLWFSTMCVVFFVGRINNIQHFFPGFRQFWKVPQQFYTGLIRVGLTYIFPITLVTTVPSQFLLNQNNYLLLGVLIATSVISLKINQLIFNYSIKNYSGASA
jgi:ABC-2 type transport system permease protein